MSITHHTKSSVFGTEQNYRKWLGNWIMKSIVEILKTIEETPGKNDKIDILRGYSFENPTIKDVLYLAYSPRFIYGLKKVEPINNAPWENLSLDSSTIEEVKTVFSALHKREVTGNAAKVVFTNLLSNFAYDDQVVICNMLKGDLRIGMDSSINKAIPNLIENAPPYMRCSLPKDGKFDEFTEEFYSQIKADGMFLNFIVDGSNYKTLTRNGNEFPLHRFRDFDREITKKISGCVDFSGAYTGEIVIYENGQMLNRKTSNGICNSIMKGGEVDFTKYDFRLSLWDLVPLESFVEKGKCTTHYKDRLNDLSGAIGVLQCGNIDVIEYRIVSNMEQAMLHYKEAKKRGLEGTVIKSADMPWIDGTSKFSIKMKDEVDIDLRIIGLNEGKGKFKELFGSIQMTSDDGMVSCNVSGISDELRKDIFENFEKDYKNKIATIRSNELITSRGRESFSLFLPRWVELRLDKNTTDDIERIKSIFESLT